MRVAPVWAGARLGCDADPAHRQEVLVDFLEGDPDRPIIVGRVYNASKSPPYGAAGEQDAERPLTRILAGRGNGNSNELRFEDKKGSEQLCSHAEKDQLIEVENDETAPGRQRPHEDDRPRRDDARRQRPHREGAARTRPSASAKNRARPSARMRTISIGENRSESRARTKRSRSARTAPRTVGEDETVSIGKNREHTIGAQEDNRQRRQAARQRPDRQGRQAAGGQEVRAAGDEITIKVGSASITMKKDGTIFRSRARTSPSTAAARSASRPAATSSLKGSKIAEN